MEPIPETTRAIDEFGPFADSDLLQQLAAKSELVRELVPDCVGLSVASRAHGVTFTLVASSQDIALLDAVQYLAGGPCVEAVKADRVVASTTEASLDEGDWHLFAQSSAAKSVASTLTLPVVADGVVAGSINLYAASVGAFTGLHAPIARIFDAWAPGAVANADLSFSTRHTAARAPEKLRRDRDTGVAVEMLAASLGIDAEAARAQLRDAARRAGVSQGELAACIIEAVRRDDTE
jgi:GAF domain-containing protein